MRWLIDPTPVAEPPPAHPFRSFTMSKSREPEAPEFRPRVPRSLPEPPGPPGRPLFREGRSRCQLLFSLFLQQLGDHLATPPKEAGFYSTNPKLSTGFFVTVATLGRGSPEAPTAPRLRSGHGVMPKVPEACVGEPRRRKTEYRGALSRLQAKS